MTTMISVVMPKKAKEVLSLIKINNIDLSLIDDFAKFDNIIPEKGEVIFERIK